MSASLIAKWSRRFGGGQGAIEPLLKGVRRQRCVDAREHLVVAESAPRTCSLLLSGFAARYKILSNGRRQITALHIAGDFVDMHDFLLARTNQGVVTLTPCQLATFDHEVLRSTTADSPHLTRLLWADTLVDAEVAREWLVAMGRRSARGRMAHLLCEMFVRLTIVDKTNGHAFHLPLTQADLADILGLSVVHVNRVLKALRNERFILMEGYTLTIVDWEELAGLAEFDPGYLGFGDEPLSAIPGTDEKAMLPGRRTLDLTL